MMQSLKHMTLCGHSIELAGLQVNEWLQVEGHTKLFAIGDANNVKETKLGYLATIQACCLCQPL